MLVTSRLEDPEQKIRWIDDHWALLEGSQGVASSWSTASVVSRHLGAQRGPGPGRDLRVGGAAGVPAQSPDCPSRGGRGLPARRRGTSTSLAGDIGFWQAPPSARPDRSGSTRIIRTCIEEVEPFTIEVLYGDTRGRSADDHPLRDDPQGTPGTRRKWFPAVARHWNLDRPDPR